MNPKDNNNNNNVGTHGPCVRLTKRKSPRAGFHNYSGGEYFVTICTLDKKHYFGEIIDFNMMLSPVGVYCRQQLEEIPSHYPYAIVPLYVVMPNHIHAIIIIDANRISGEDHNKTHEPHSITVTADQSRTHEPCVPTVRTALSVVIGGLKRAVTLFARRNDFEFGWQSRYHDHIIRGNHDGNRIAEYIDNNVARWAEDCFYS